MILEDILKNYILDEETGCWNWQGAVSGSRGYGQVRFGPDSKLWSVHRLMADQFIRPLKPREVVHHTCNNPLCMNLDHIQILENQKEHIVNYDAGRKKKNSGNTNMLAFRVNDNIDTILTNAMEETGLSKSELLRKIILEWNMLRYNED